MGDWKGEQIKDKLEAMSNVRDTTEYAEIVSKLEKASSDAKETPGPATV